MAFPTTSVLDDFNRANEGPPPSANWSTDQYGAALPGWVVASNVATPNGASAATYWSADTFGPDCEVYVTVVSWNFAGNEIDLSIRLQGGVGTAAVDGYAIKLIKDTNLIRVLRYDNSAGTALGADFAQAVSDGDSVGVECVGDQISAYYKAAAGSWTLLGSRTDATHSGAGNLGVYAGNNATTIDSFGGGTYVSGTSGGMLLGIFG